MGVHTVKHEQTPFLSAAMDSPFDTALRQHFGSEAEPDDDGFSQRVLAVLPARTVRRNVRWVEWVARAQWTAISLASCGVAALMPISDERIDVAQITAAYTLIGLLVFWSIPSRWSRG
jgi:hypothetical protein